MSRCSTLKHPAPKPVLHFITVPACKIANVTPEHL
nr:MAG TPA: hypothetical protein [Caudoviricetes sp.]